MRRIKEIYELDKATQLKVLQRLEESQAFRVEFFKDRIYSFWLYYFWHFFKSPSSYKHKEICKNLEDDKHLLLIAFREFWKSIWIKVFLIHSICYKRFNYCLFFSFDQKKSSARLFDIVNDLKINKKIIRDFWLLFPSKAMSKEDEGLEKKSVNEFITTNKVKFQAMSIWTSPRWLMYSNDTGAYRPDLIILDDVDTSASIRNPEIVHKNTEFMENELFWWIDNNAKVVFLWNVISNIWLVPYFESKVKESNRWNLQKIPIYVNNEIVWNRFVETDKEAEEFKKKGIIKISLEKKREMEWDEFNPNFLLVPSIWQWSPVFNHDKVREIEILQDYKTIDSINGLRIYQEPQICTFWVDTALWTPNWDYSTIVARNHKKELVLTYQWRVEPYVLAEILWKIFKMKYIWKVIAERNSIWHSTTKALSQHPLILPYLYREKDIDTITQKPKDKFWFWTWKNKDTIVNALKECINKWEIKWIDERTFEEMLHYFYDQKTAANALQGFHDDLVMAEVLCLVGLQQKPWYVFK